MRKAKKEEKDVFESPLKNKKVTIALIKQISSSVYSDPDDGTLAMGCSKSFTCPISNVTGKFVDPLTYEERKFLEDMTGLDLSIHKNEDNFYKTKSARVILRKTGRKNETANVDLDLSDPYQYILYKIALINPRVANSWGDRYENRIYEFVIVDGEVELEEEYSYTDVEDDVLEYLLSIKNSKRKLFDLLRMYGIQNVTKHVSYANTAQWMYNELKKACRKPSEVKKLHKFIKLGGKDISDRIFLQDCVTVGVIEKRGVEYRYVGGDTFARTEIDALNILNSKENSSLKLQFQGAIEDFYNEEK